MNKHLDDAIARVSELPDEKQEAAAVLLLDFLKSDEYQLTPDQIAEVRRRLEANDIVADQEIEEFFKRMKQ